MFWLLIEFVVLHTYPLACEQALRGGGQRYGGEAGKGRRACNYISGI